MDVEAEDVSLRMAYVEDGPADGPLVLLLHGEPAWSFLYRHMIGPLAAAGRRRAHAVPAPQSASWFGHKACL